MKRKLLFAVIIIAVVAFAGYKFIYKEHRDISSESTAFTPTVVQLQQEFAASDSIANAKYADQTIEVKGKITSVDVQANSMVIDGKLSAVLKNKMETTVQPNQQVKIKGRFVGYDDLLEELKMDQATIIK
jgi:multidrug efflux pump subunit AcrA (membrane-fusion protein)